MTYGNNFIKTVFHYIRPSKSFFFSSSKIGGNKVLFFFTKPSYNSPVLENIKNSSFFYNTQLLDMFSLHLHSKEGLNTIYSLFYSHSLKSRFFLVTSAKNSIDSVENIFFNAD